MGIVAKQALANTIVTYFGFVVGAANALFLYPYFLTKTYYGLVTYLLSVSTLFFPLLAFGMHNALIKFYSALDTESDKNKLLTLILFVPAGIAMMLGVLGCFNYHLINALLEQNIEHIFEKKENLVTPYLWLIFIISFSIAYFEIFYAWSRVQLKSIFGNFMKEVFHRIIISILLITIYYQYITVQEFIWCLAVAYVLRMAIMMFFAFYIRAPKFNFKRLFDWKGVLKYAFLMLTAGSIATILLDLNTVMIKEFLSIENVSIYYIGASIAISIGVPSRAMQQIISPLTSQFLNTKNRLGLKKLSIKSSLTLLIFSGYIFSLVIGNVASLYQLIPDTYTFHIEVILCIGTVKLFDNALGNTNAILFNSSHYQSVLILGILIAVFAVILNLFFIPKYGLNGAALASFIAFSSYNLLKLLFLYRKFNLYPYQWKHLWVLVLIITITGISYFFNFQFPVWKVFQINFSVLANIALKAIIISIVYWLFVYYSNWSEDINHLIRRRKKIG